VETVFPDWVSETPQGVKVVNPDARTTIGLTVESFRQLKKENDELRSKLEANQASTAKLSDRLDGVLNGRDPITGGVGFGRGALLLVGLGLGSVIGFVRRKRSEPQV
jgi:hypothetical protein